MRHKRSGTFAYYIQVQDDTQSAFLETSSRDALIKLSTNASLTRDASAFQKLSPQLKQNLEKDPELTSLQYKRDSLRVQLISKYHQLYKSRETDLYKNFKEAQNKVRAKRKKLYTSAKDMQYNEFFENIGNQIIENNYQGGTIRFEPDISYIVPERTILAELEFKNRYIDNINDTDLVENRVYFLELRLASHQLQVPIALQRRIRFDQPSVENMSEKTSLLSNSGLECPVCLGRSDVHAGHSHINTLERIRYRDISKRISYRPTFQRVAHATTLAVI